MTTQSVTSTSTTVNTVTSAIVVGSQMGIEMATIKLRAPHVQWPDIEKTLKEVIQFLVEGVVGRVTLRFLLGNEPVHTYRYTVSEAAEAWGPAPENVPVGQLPPGTRAEISVGRHPDCPQDEFEAALERMGWTCSVVIIDAPGTVHEVYGVFQSGTFAMERSLGTNPKYRSDDHATEVRKP
jgi:hypothetical protein